MRLLELSQSIALAILTPNVEAQPPPKAVGWHMARTPALQQALSNAWLKAQGLVSVKDL